MLIDCVLTDAVGAVGWQLDQAGPGAASGASTELVSAVAGVHFWEYESHDPAGKPVDMSWRLAIARRLKLPNDQETVANYSDPKFVLAGEWTPALAPIITMQPAAVTASEGQQTVLSVSVVAVPAPTYQWQKNGKNIRGANQSDYKIERAKRAYAGHYAAVISNAAGNVISAPATLTITSRKHHSH